MKAAKPSGERLRTVKSAARGGIAPSSRFAPNPFSPEEGTTGRHPAVGADQEEGDNRQTSSREQNLFYVFAAVRAEF